CRIRCARPRHQLDRVSRLSGLRRRYGRGDRQRQGRARRHRLRFGHRHLDCRQSQSQGPRRAGARHDLGPAVTRAQRCECRGVRPARYWSRGGARGAQGVPQHAIRRRPPCRPRCQAFRSSKVMTQAAVKHDTPLPMFTTSLAEADPAIDAVLKGELHRQQEQIELIASENIVSRAVLEAAGSVLTNKYAEGYPGRRYYGGCEEVDKAEQLAIDRACKLFDCSFANVQPHSGAQANQAVFMALLKPGDTFLGMALDQGGHLTHGSPANQSGKWFRVVSYGVKPDTHMIDYAQMEEVARREKPKLIIAGASAYWRQIDWARFRKTADEIGAYFMVDMAHYAGLIAAGVYPSPLPHAHVVTTTTHKTLRGPRGGMILSTDPELGKKINSAVFPGLQGGPLMHIIAAKAVALGEALRPDFKTYARQVIDNAQALAASLTERGLKIISGGTDSHVMLVDLR